MEPWRAMIGLSVLLVVFAAVAALTGQRATPLDIAAAVVFGAVGLYLGRVLSDRFLRGKE